MSNTTSTNNLKPLKGTRIVSIALNLPGPAALLRCARMGASCIKVEPPAPASMPAGSSGDPMAQYNHRIYEVLHKGIRTVVTDLKTESGQKKMQRELEKAHVLITSSRPSALARLGLDWKTLHKRYPELSMVEIVGSPGVLAEIPGHDLTYQAENNLISGLATPASLFADMGGSLMASEAVLQARLVQLQKDKGVRMEIALSEAAAYLALPNAWGMTSKGAILGGGHAGYKVYPCKDGRAVVAALEPHFAKALGEAAGLESVSVKALFDEKTHAIVAAFFAGKTCKELDALAVAKDIPLHTLKP